MSISVCIYIYMVSGPSRPTFVYVHAIIKLIKSCLLNAQNQCRILAKIQGLSSSIQKTKKIFKKRIKRKKKKTIFQRSWGLGGLPRVSDFSLLLVCCFLFWFFQGFWFFSDSVFFCLLHRSVYRIRRDQLS